jgi:hypothetical protein
MLTDSLFSLTQLSLDQLFAITAGLINVLQKTCVTSTVVFVYEVLTGN